jgi:hypothetical protein
MVCLASPSGILDIFLNEYRFHSLHKYFPLEIPITDTEIGIANQWVSSSNGSKFHLVKADPVLP